MPNLSVRNLDESTYRRLRLRATKHGNSMEEEVRQIIMQAVTVPERMSAVFEKHFGQKNGVDLQTSKHQPHQPMEFDE